jgi:hypothetical protein
MKKKYKSLGDIYAEKSLGKQLPLIERLKVMLKEQPEKTINVLAQSQDGEPELLGSVDTKGLTKISNIVKSDVSTETLQKLLKVCNLSAFYTPVRQIFEKYNINYGEVQRLLIDGKSSLDILSHKIIGKKGKINLKELLYPVIRKIITETDQNDVEEFFRDVFNLSGLENFVAVGKGEILLILLTEGVKVVYTKGEITKGDIMLPDKTALELKVGAAGSGGRIDTKRGGGFKKMDAGIQEIISKRLNNQEISFQDVASLEMKYVTADEVNKILPVVNAQTNPKLIEGIVLSASLVGYAKQGFKYILMMNRAGATSTFDMTYFDAQDQGNIINSILASEIGMEVDKEGLTVTTDAVRERRIFKQKKK